MSLAINNEVQNAIWQNNFPATPAPANFSTLLTAHATPHSKGAYATLIASTTYDSYGFWLMVSGSVAAAALSDMLLDIAIGASQENVIVPEWQCGWSAAPSAGAQVTWWPIFIPKGSAISARIQALITVDTARVAIVLNGGASAFPGPMCSGCDAYGTSAASSMGTSHTPGNSGAESTAANIGGTLTKNYGAVMISVQGTNTTTTAIAYHWELQIGGVTVCEWYTVNTTGAAVVGPFPPAPFLCSLPYGTQLQVRAEASGTAQAQEVASHCFD